MIGSAAVTENLLKRKWSATILRYFESGVTDPSEIIRHERDLSQLAMNERLRTMLRYGLVVRFPRPGVFKLVDYRLTARGTKVLKILDLIEQLDRFPVSNVSTVQDFSAPSPLAAPAEIDPAGQPPDQKEPRRKPSRLSA